MVLQTLKQDTDNLNKFIANFWVNNFFDRLAWDIILNNPAILSGEDLVFLSSMAFFP